MRQIDVSQIRDVVSELCMRANYELGEDVLHSLEYAKARESEGRAQEILQMLIDNAKLAKEERLPICQDTGIVVVFLEIGQALHIVGGDLFRAVTLGVKNGYEKGYLRSSIVDDPIKRENIDNVPPVIYTKITPGDRLKIMLISKGCGSENMGSIKMLKPHEGGKGIIDFVIRWVREVASFACPPIVVGIGIGGTFEKAAMLSKMSLCRKIGEFSPISHIANIEKILFQQVNKLGIGPAGFGGRTTCLAVNIETYPTHIAALPVAVNINCHAHRYKEAVI
ncbi:MAG: fumarate hydratase [bacterium]|nr:fumarate hydratase [bacterium]